MWALHLSDGEEFLQALKEGTKKHEAYSLSIIMHCHSIISMQYNYYLWTGNIVKSKLKI